MEEDWPLDLFDNIEREILENREETKKINLEKLLPLAFFHAALYSFLLL